MLKIARTFVVCSVLATYLMSGCHSKEQLAEERRQAQEIATAKRDIATLSSQYKPVVDWQPQIRDKLYTIDLEPALVRKDRRPLLFYGAIEDIRRDGTTVAYYFRTVSVSSGDPDLQLVLTCSKCTPESFDDPNRSLGDYAIVANIDSVAKPSDTSEGAPDFILHGDMVDSRFIGDYLLNATQNQSK